jgi:opine dehydrogenase
MMKPNIATFGNQPINLGHAIAADLTLAGYKVNVFDLPEYENALEPIRELGGIHVTGDPKVIASGKTGFAKLNLVTTDPEKALRDVDLLFIDIPAHQFESRLKPIIPYIKDGAVLHFNYYGYWPSLRVAPLLREAGKKNIKITECPSCLYFARGQGGHLDFHVMRKSIALSVFPGRKSQEVFDMMNTVYPNFYLAKNILQTNFENLNMLWHPSIALLRHYRKHGYSFGSPGQRERKALSGVWSALYFSQKTDQTIFRGHWKDDRRGPAECQFY